MSVQDCTRTKEKLATTESDLNDKNARLGSVTSELSECQTKMKNLEEARTSQDKAITKISSENKELVLYVTFPTNQIILNDGIIYYSPVVNRSVGNVKDFGC